MSSGAITDKGLLRKINQDSYLLIDDGKVVFGAVCDGIGGGNAGEIASMLACDELKNHYHQNAPKREDVINWLNEAVDKANDKVFIEGLNNENYRGMGTTLVGFLVIEDSSFVINVGDSRCYVIDQNDNMHLITKDHTLFNDLLAKGNMDEETISKFVTKNIISKAIGITHGIKPDIFEINNNDYQTLMLCSDGLSSYVDKDFIKEVLLTDLTIEEKCTHLVAKANENGGYDNITIVIYQR